MLSINKEKCVGCGICVDICPLGFEMRGDKSSVKNPDADCINKAISSCPTGAIISDKDNRSEKNQSIDFDRGERMGRGLGRGKGRGLGVGPRDGRGRGRGGGGRRR